MTDRLPVHAIDPAGATDGDRPTYDAASGRVVWAAPSAGTGVVQTIVAGAGISVNSTDPANPVVSATGGGGGSGRSVDNPTDTTWGTASAYDQEFDTDATTPPSGWSWVNQGTSTFEAKYGSALITPQTAAWRSIVQPIPTATTWTATAHLAMEAPNTNWSRCALILRDSVSGKITALSITAGSTWQVRNIAVNDWSSNTGFGGGETRTGYMSLAEYVRIVKNSTGTHTFQYSVAGVGWVTLVANKAAYATYDQIGFGAWTDVAGVPCVMHWLRVR